MPERSIPNLSRVLNRLSWLTIGQVIISLVTIASIGCKSNQKKHDSSPLAFPQNHSDIDWNELVRNQNKAEQGYSKKSLKSSESDKDLRPIPSQKQTLTDKQLELSTSYLYNLHKTVPFEKVTRFRDGLLARTKDKSFFYITPNPTKGEEHKIDQTMVQMMSEHLSCFVRAKIENENLSAYRCRDGRVVKFLVKKDNVFTKVSAKAYENVKLEWIALESSFTGNIQ